MKAREIVLHSCYFLYIGMYVYAAVAKLITHQVFVAQLNHQPVGQNYSDFLSWGLPVAEILIAVLIAFTKRIGIYFATGLMTIFTTYIVLVQLKFFDSIPCSCGGIISQLTWTQHLFFNLTFLLIGTIAIYLQRTEKRRMLSFIEKRMA